MDIKTLKKKWFAIVNAMNSNGVPIPMVRDPKTSLSSVSLTLVIISFNFCLIGLAGKLAGFFGGIDMAQALNLFYACSLLYFGRKIAGKKDDPADVEIPKVEEKEESK